ncbi:retrovirus-related pol polyprotein from transposon TNT 1-94 [Tanacetum coccineum]
MRGGDGGREEERRKGSKKEYGIERGGVKRRRGNSREVEEEEGRWREREEGGGGEGELGGKARSIGVGWGGLEGEGEGLESERGGRGGELEKREGVGNGRDGEKGREKPALGFMRPFGCPVTILNTIDHLSKFDGKADEGFFVGYSLNSKSFRVFNSRTRIVEENVHVQFSENTPNIAGSGPNWLFDIDALTKTMNYNPIVAGNQSNGNVSTKASNDADSLFSSLPKSSPDDGFKPLGDGETEKDSKIYTTSIHTVSTPVNVASSTFINVHGSTWINVAEYHDDLNMPDLEDIASSENEVWTLVDLPNGKRAISTKWVYRNKKDKRDIVIRNKARLVAQGYTQEEGIDYDKEWRSFKPI